jgi:hypothetical protein
MLGMTGGELFVVVFIVVAVVSAPWWPRLGGVIAIVLAGKRPPRSRSGS